MKIYYTIIPLSAYGIMAQVISLPLIEIHQTTSLEAEIDSLPTFATQGLSQRLAQLPSMRMDLEGRIKWRGTDEFLVDFNDIPIDAHQLSLIPSSIQADISTDPQANASHLSAGMNGWIHIIPQKKSTAFEIQAGGAHPFQEWLSLQGSSPKSNYQSWFQLHHQGNSETRTESWVGENWHKQLNWPHHEIRNFGLGGLSYQNQSQQWSIETWGNQNERTFNYSRSTPSQNTIPQEQALMGALQVSWIIQQQDWQFFTQLDGFQSHQIVNWQEDSTQTDKKYSRGIMEISKTWLGIQNQIGLEQRWNGLELSPSLYSEEITQSAYYQATQEFYPYHWEVGIRLESSHRLDPQNPTQTKYNLLPSAGLSAQLPWFESEVFGRYSFRLQNPEATQILSGRQKISPFEGRIGNPDLKTEEIQNIEYGIGAPFKQIQAKLEVKGFLALAENMLLREWTWIQDTAFLRIQNGQGEERAGAEVSWNQNFKHIAWNLAGSLWVEDREIKGPKEELFGACIKINEVYNFHPKWSLQSDLAWTGPSFEPEGKAEPYLEEKLILSWKPSPTLKWDLGAESLGGNDRSLSQNSASGESWTRTRHSPTRLWTEIKWSLGPKS